MHLEVGGPSFSVGADLAGRDAWDWWYSWRGAAAADLYVWGAHGPPMGVFPRRLQRRWPLLRRHRLVRLASAGEAEAVVEALLRHGGGQSNDTYLFPARGGWLMFVTHHDQIHVTVPVGPPGRASKLSS